MFIDSNSDTPIFHQIAENIKSEIATGTIRSHDKIYSTNELASILKINPSTALKGINLLIEDGILYKKRGLGMFVSEEAYIKIIDEKKTILKQELVYKIVVEAKKIGVDLETLQNYIEEMYREV